MPSPANTEPTRRKLRNVGTAVLEAARDGSLVDLMDLSENLAKVPYSLLPEALDVLLSYLEKPSILSDPRLISDPYKYANAALMGVAAFVALDDFRRNPAFAKRLLDAWPRILDSLIVFYRDAQATGRTGNITGLMAFTSQVFQHLHQVDGIGIVRALANEKSQIFIYELWLRDYEDNSLVYQCAKLLPACVTWGSKSMDCLLKAAGGPTPAKLAANAIIGRLNGVLDGAVPKSDREEYISVYSMLLSGFLQVTDHEIARAIVDCGGVRTGMRVLWHLVRKTDQKHLVLLYAPACFALLAHTFDIRAGTLCKAIRMGFLDAFFRFSPRFGAMEAAQPGSLSALRDTLVRIIPRDLIYTKTIKAMSDAMMSSNAEERDRMDKSVLREEWLNVEMILVERLAAFRMYIVSQRVVRCDTCGTRDIKTAFKRCSRCKKALYCSQACQSRAWKSLGHKTSCSNEAGNPSTKRQRITSIEDLLATRDTRRYFAGAVMQSLGSLALFDPSKYMVKLDYTGFPVTYEILEVAEFLRTCPVSDLKASAAELASGLPRAATKHDMPPRVLCASIFWSSLDKIITVEAIELDPFWMHATTLPDGRRRTLPRAAVQVRAKLFRKIGRTLSENALKMEPKMDSIDFLLSMCGTTLEEFWTLDFDDIVLTWHKDNDVRENSVSPM